MKGDGTAILEGLPIINEAVIVVKALEHLWVDEASRAEPATVQVNTSNFAPTNAKIHDLNGVGGNATRKRCCGTLVYYNISLAAFVTPNSVRLRRSSGTMMEKLAMSTRESVVAIFLETHTTRPSIRISKKR